MTDVAITGHGYRSVSGVPYPLSVEEATMDELTAIPGIGKRTAGDVVVNRPYENLGAVPGVDALEPFVDAGDAV